MIPTYGNGLLEERRRRTLCLMAESVLRIWTPVWKKEEDNGGDDAE